MILKLGQSLCNISGRTKGRKTMFAVRHREVCRAKDFSAPLRIAMRKIKIISQVSG